MFDKINVFIGSLVGCVLFLISLFPKQIGLCSSSYDYSTCLQVADIMATIFLPVIPFFIFVCLTYFMRKEIYGAWIKFGVLMLGTAMLLTAVTPNSVSGGFGPQILIDSSDVALLTSVIFVIVSIVVIYRAYSQTRK